jgi:hypothetical protein
MGVPILLATKVENSLAHTNVQDSFQSANVPIKIWIAQDDTSVSYSQANAFITRLKNYGCVAEMRTMPSNTGGHYSVDTDSNAPQTTNVTTPLGVLYATIPTAFYELELYFRGLKAIR